MTVNCKKVSYPIAARSPAHYEFLIFSNIPREYYCTTPLLPLRGDDVMGTLLGWCVYFFGNGRRVLGYLRARVMLCDGWQSSTPMWEIEPATVSEIAAAVRFSPWRVRVCLRLLERDGLARADSSGRWRIILDQ